MNKKSGGGKYTSMIITLVLKLGFDMIFAKSTAVSIRE